MKFTEIFFYTEIYVQIDFLHDFFSLQLLRGLQWLQKEKTKFKELLFVCNQ